MAGVATGRVSPFGHPGITARLQLPQAYRSLPRPSSPLDAKASTVCLIAFDLNFDRFVMADHALRPTMPVLIPHTRSASCLTDQSSIHRLSKSSSDPNPPVLAKVPDPTKKKRALESERVRATSETLSPPPYRPALTRDLQKGGDPAAGSPTATLLRLRPSH
jgi:hypothetical protein